MDEDAGTVTAGGVDRRRDGRYRHLEGNERRVGTLKGRRGRVDILRGHRNVLVNVPHDGRVAIVADESQTDRGPGTVSGLDPCDVHVLPGQRREDIAPQPVVPHRPDGGHLGAKPGEGDRVSAYCCTLLLYAP